MFASKLAVIVIAFSLAGCAGRHPGDPLKPGCNIYSKAQDIELGRQAAQQVRQQVDIVDNKSLQRYIDELGGILPRQPAAGDGSAGAVATLASESPFGGTEKDVILTVARPEGLFYMVFIAPNQDFDQFQGAFDQMMRSIRFRG